MLSFAVAADVRPYLSAYDAEAFVVDPGVFGFRPRFFAPIVQRCSFMHSYRR